MRILIDADGCPVIKACVNSAKINNIECIIVCDTSHVFEYENIEVVTVSKGADSADFAIVNLIKIGDIVVTQDYGLAAMSLSKKAICINQNGMIYNEHNIGDLLSVRHISKKIRNSGGRVKGPLKRTKAQDDTFLKTLTELIKSRAAN